MVTGDRLIRAATAAVVVAVAGFAAAVSYAHIYDLGRAHGQSGAAARLLPLSVDGLILAASLVLLHEARNGRGAPVLARVMLWLGISATVGANAAYGAPFGALGVLVSTWPAAAFVGAAEMVMLLVRRSRATGGLEAAGSAPPVPADVNEAVRLAHLAGQAAGEPVSQRQRAERFGVSRRQVSRARAAAGNGRASLNGHGEGVS